jgi:hypothetical protein
LKQGTLPEEPEIKKEGLLASQYEVNQGEKFPGRAMVLFAPTHLAELNQSEHALLMGFLEEKL